MRSCNRHHRVLRQGIPFPGSFVVHRIALARN